MYTGKEVCQGCGKSGTELPRYEKNMLCENCKAELRKARAINFVSEIKYVRIRQHYHAFQSLSFNDDPLGKMMIKLLTELSNPYAEATGLECIQYTQGDNCLWVNIPEKLLVPLREFNAIISDYIREIKKEKESLPKMAKDAVQSEKDRIFNEGIEKGRNLLYQLNNNEITPDQFLKPCHYNNQ